VFRIQIQCVIVLYNTAPTDSQTICSLISCYKQHRGLAEQLSVLIYDNSPYSQKPSSIKGLGEAEYFHDGANGGLAAAYNYALTIARQREIQWLLLLDQDTLLEVGLFLALSREICATPSPSVCAFVPKLVRDEFILSPQIVERFRNKPVSRHFFGLSSRPLTALNSAACLRVDAAVQVGGFPHEYWLDYLDHAMFHRLRVAGGQIVTLDVALQHHLSSRNLEVEMSAERYANMLSAEWMLVREIGWVWGPLIHRLRLLKRGLGHYVKLHNKSYALRALHSAFS
jgi:GT2 family glycosyltransferase